LNLLSVACACGRVLIHREPHPLYRWLMREGYRYQTRFDPEGWFEIRISRH